MELIVIIIIVYKIYKAVVKEKENKLNKPIKPNEDIFVSQTNKNVKIDNTVKQMASEFGLDDLLDDTDEDDDEFAYNEDMNEDVFNEKSSQENCAIEVMPKVAEPSKSTKSPVKAPLFEGQSTEGVYSLNQSTQGECIEEHSSYNEETPTNSSSEGECIQEHSSYKDSIISVFETHEKKLADYDNSITDNKKDENSKNPMEFSKNQLVQGFIMKEILTAKYTE